MRIQLPQSVVNHPCIRMLLELLRNSQQFSRKPVIIGIQQRDIFPASVPQSEIERRRLSSIRFPKIANLAAEFSHAFLGVVRRAIIYD